MFDYIIRAGAPYEDLGAGAVPEHLRDRYLIFVANHSQRVEVMRSA